MSKIVAVSMVLLLLMIVALAGCAASPAPAELKTIDIKLVSVTPIFQGTESVSYNIVYSLSNTNNFEVRVDSLEYILTTEDVILSARQNNKGIYIPAGKIVEAPFFFTGDFSSLIANKVKGVPPTEMAAAGLPFWKSLGGKLPNATLKDTWDKTTDSKLTFKATGLIALSGSGLTQSQLFNVSVAEEQ